MQHLARKRGRKLQKTASEALSYIVTANDLHSIEIDQEEDHRRLGIFAEDLQGVEYEAWRGAKRPANERQRWRNFVVRCSSDNWRH